MTDPYRPPVGWAADGDEEEGTVDGRSMIVEAGPPTR
jgi:hypothetical protein